jgi:hypothetical protein
MLYKRMVFCYAVRPRSAFDNYPSSWVITKDTDVAGVFLCCAFRKVRPPFFPKIRQKLVGKPLDTSPKLCYNKVTNVQLTKRPTNKRRTI